MRNKLIVLIAILIIVLSCLWFAWLKQPAPVPTITPTISISATPTDTPEPPTATATIEPTIVITIVTKTTTPTATPAATLEPTVTAVPPTPTVTATPALITHTVKSGETITSITGDWYGYDCIYDCNGRYGDTLRWLEVCLLNMPPIAKCHEILPGWILRLPED